MGAIFSPLGYIKPHFVTINIKKWTNLYRKSTYFPIFRMSDTIYSYHDDEGYAEDSIYQTDNITTPLIPDKESYFSEYSTRREPRYKLISLVGTQGDLYQIRITK